MKWLNTWILLVAICCWANSADAELRLLPGATTPRVFAGKPQTITISWQNTGEQLADAKIHMMLYQASSATVMPVYEKYWKRLQILPQQIVIESAHLNLPNVRAETKFLIQWLGTSNQVLGVTEVWVYPTNLLVELQSLARGNSLGIFDPQNLLKPLLKNLQIEFADLGNFSLADFSGKLAVIGPFQSRANMPADLPKKIKALAKKNVAVVWIQPPSKSKKIQPSFYSVPEKRVAVVIVQPELVSDLAKNPQSQLNLIYFCELALHPKFFTLPDLLSQPTTR